MGIGSLAVQEFKKWGIEPSSLIEVYAYVYGHLIINLHNNRLRYKHDRDIVHETGPASRSFHKGSIASFTVTDIIQEAAHSFHSVVPLAAAIVLAT